MTPSERFRRGLPVLRWFGIVLATFLSVVGVCYWRYIAFAWAERDHGESFWARLQRGNWPSLLLATLLAAALVYCILLLFRRLLPALRSARATLLVAVAVAVPLGGLAAVTYRSFLGHDHWRQHCFTVCLLPEDEGLAVLLAGCVASGLVFAHRAWRAAA